MIHPTTIVAALVSMFACRIVRHGAAIHVGHWQHSRWQILKVGMVLEQVLWVYSIRIACGRNLTVHIGRHVGDESVSLGQQMGWDLQGPEGGGGHRAVLRVGRRRWVGAVTVAGATGRVAGDAGRRVQCLCGGAGGLRRHRPRHAGGCRHGGGAGRHSRHCLKSRFGWTRGGGRKHDPAAIRIGRERGWTRGLSGVVCRLHRAGGRGRVAVGAAAARPTQTATAGAAFQRTAHHERLRFVQPFDRILRRVVVVVDADGNNVRRILGAYLLHGVDQVRGHGLGVGLHGAAVLRHGDDILHGQTHVCVRGLWHFVRPHGDVGGSSGRVARRHDWRVRRVGLVPVLCGHEWREFGFRLHKHSRLHGRGDL